MDVFKIKRGDTAPPFRARCLDGDVPVDLASASQVRLLMRSRGSVLLAGAMVRDDQATSPGWVTYTWGVTDTDTAGTYRGEVEVTWGDGKVQTFPPDGHVMISVAEDLG